MPQIIEMMVGDEDPKRFSGKMRTTGIITLVLGVLALIVPVFFGLALWFTLGAFLVAGGILQIVYAIQSKYHRTINIVQGALFLLAGILFFLMPAGGLVFLAILLGFLFALEGGLKLYYAFSLKKVGNPIWISISGIASLLLAILLWMGVPEAAPWMVGVLIGVSLVVNGVSMISLSSLVR